MKTRILAASKHHSSAYAWYLSGFSSSQPGLSAPLQLRPFIYPAKQRAGTGMQQTSANPGVNWSFWRTGATVPSLVFVALAFGFGCALVETSPHVLHLIPRWGGIVPAQLTLTSPLLLFAALSASHALWRTGLAGEPIARRALCAPARGSLGGLPVLGVLAIAGMGAQLLWGKGRAPMGALRARNLVPHGSCVTLVGGLRCSSDWALLPSRAVEATTGGLFTWLAPAPRTRGLANGRAVGAAELVCGLGARPVPARTPGLGPVSCGLG